MTACVKVAEACAAVGRPDQARQALTYAEEAAFTPMGVANSCPVVVGKEWNKLGFPAEALKLAAKLPLAGDRLDLTIAAADAFAAAGDQAEAQAVLQAAMAAYTPAVDPVLAVEAITAAASRSASPPAGPCWSRPRSSRPACRPATEMAPSPRSHAPTATWAMTPPPRGPPGR